MGLQKFILSSIYRSSGECFHLGHPFSLNCHMSTLQRFRVQRSSGGLKVDIWQLREKRREKKIKAQICLVGTWFPSSFKIPMQALMQHPSSSVVPPTVMETLVSKQTTIPSSTSAPTSTILPSSGQILQERNEKGIVVRQYRKGNLLGKGGFALCFEYKEDLTEKIYAIKTISKANLDTKEKREKMRTEIEIHAELKHPHIVQFVRSFITPEYCCIVLEKCANKACPLSSPLLSLCVSSSTLFLLFSLMLFPCLFFFFFFYFFSHL
jgi:hypothetical protein